MKQFTIVLILILVAGLAFGAKAFEADLKSITSMPNNPGLVRDMPENLPHATFAGGCFWCVESEFRPLDGVVFTRAGYIGGQTENPTYEQITTGKTGHAEAIEIYYDPDKITYEDLVLHFLDRAHDPTQINRQGVDVGPQYRSAIFYHDDDQRATARAVMDRLTAAKRFKKPIATELTAASTFWLAEDYHQQYYEKYEQKTGEPHLRVLLKKQK